METHNKTQMLAHLAQLAELDSYLYTAWKNYEIANETYEKCRGLIKKASINAKNGAINEKVNLNNLKQYISKYERDIARTEAKNARIRIMKQKARKANSVKSTRAKAKSKKPDYKIVKNRPKLCIKAQLAKISNDKHKLYQEINHNAHILKLKHPKKPYKKPNIVYDPKVLGISQ